MSFVKDEAYFNFQRSDLVEMLPSVQGRFLEIGCGSGATLQYLKSKGASYVAGVDISEESIRLAIQRGVDKAILLDVEKDDLPFAEEEFDCVIMADVLEHLYDPWSALKRIAAYLKPGGLVLFSIPNVRHYTILWRLIVRDEWSYSDAGILDNSHIRFFTLSEIKKLLDGAGLKIVLVNGRKSAGKKFTLLNRLFFNTLGPFMVGQYLIMAKK